MAHRSENVALYFVIAAVKVAKQSFYFLAF
jgi:hypothetical protein